MKADLLIVFLGFLEGFALISSPCILPILPIVLAGSLSGSKKRPLGIVCGFCLSFALFAYFSRKFVQLTGIDLNVLRHISYFLLVLFGLVLCSSYLSEKFSQCTGRLDSRGMDTLRRTHSCLRYCPNSHTANQPNQFFCSPCLISKIGIKNTIAKAW